MGELHLHKTLCGLMHFDSQFGFHEERNANGLLNSSEKGKEGAEDAAGGVLD